MPQEALKLALAATGLQEARGERVAKAVEVRGWQPGAADDRCYPDDLDSDGVYDGVAYDRSPGTGGNNWSDAADDTITILSDVLLVLDQSGAGPCPRAAPPP